MSVAATLTPNDVTTVTNVPRTNFVRHHFSRSGDVIHPCARLEGTSCATLMHFNIISDNAFLYYIRLQSRDCIQLSQDKNVYRNCNSVLSNNGPLNYTAVPFLADKLYRCGLDLLGFP